MLGLSWGHGRTQTRDGHDGPHDRLSECDTIERIATLGDRDQGAIEERRRDQCALVDIDAIVHLAARLGITDEGGRERPQVGAATDEGRPDTFI